MTSFLRILPLQRDDIAAVTDWARQERFAPGSGDVAIYRHTDRQGIWVGWLGSERIGCITGVRYNAAYGFLGLYLVRPTWRGRGYGLQLWEHALEHLADLPCVGLEAAPDRVDDYARWGFAPASPTTRWQGISDGTIPTPAAAGDWQLLEGEAIPERAVQCFDAQREPSPRPHFLSQWLHHPAGTVLALIDSAGDCHRLPWLRPHPPLPAGARRGLAHRAADGRNTAGGGPAAAGPAAPPSGRGADRCARRQCRSGAAAGAVAVPPGGHHPAHVPR